MRVVRIFFKSQERLALRTLHPQVLQPIIDDQPLLEMDRHVEIDCAFSVRIPYVGPEDICTAIFYTAFVLHRIIEYFVYLFLGVGGKILILFVRRVHFFLRRKWANNCCLVF